MQAVLLVGGFGTRLSHVVKDVPKPMAPIKDVPFLKYIYDQLTSMGVDNFIFLTGHKADVIENYFKDYKNIRFIRETSPLGTGGALLNAYEYLDDSFLFVNGDTFFDIDLSILEDFSFDKPFVMALRYTDNIERYGFVKLDANNSYLIDSFVEKGCLPKDQIDGYINGGFYIVKKTVLEGFTADFNGQMISFENEVIPKLISTHSAYGLPMGGAFIDIGVPEDYFAAQNVIPKRLAQDTHPALFIDKDGTMIVDSGYCHGKDIELIDETIPLVKSYKEQGYYLVMITNQAGVAKSKFGTDDMNANINAVAQAYAKEGITFDDIELCCYHEDAVLNEYKYKSLARKPNPGMLLKACEKLRIDLSKSIMYGDNEEVDTINLPYLSCVIRLP